MVSGLRASDTAGTSVSQCAETATIALGLGSVLPSEARKERAGTSSRIKVGEPCETKMVGMDIALFLALLMAACVQSESNTREGRDEAPIAELRHCDLPRPAVRRAGRRANPQDGRSFRPESAR